MIVFTIAISVLEDHDTIFQVQIVITLIGIAFYYPQTALIIKFKCDGLVYVWFPRKKSDVKILRNSNFCDRLFGGGRMLTRGLRIDCVFGVRLLG